MIEETKTFKRTTKMIADEIEAEKQQGWELLYEDERMAIDPNSSSEYAQHYIEYVFKKIKS